MLNLLLQKIKTLLIADLFARKFRVDQIAQNNKSLENEMERLWSEEYSKLREYYAVGKSYYHYCQEARSFYRLCLIDISLNQGFYPISPAWK